MTTATTTDDNSAPVLEQYFSYLTLVADSQMNAKLRAKEEPSDIVQETMLEAHRDFERFRGRTDAELRAWLRTILTNNLVSAARYHSRQKRNGGVLSLNSQLELACRQPQYYSNNDPSFPGLKIAQQERSEKLAAALRRLLADERTAVTLKHFHNQSVAEIAQHLGRTREAVAGLLRRGLRKLRTHFKDEISASRGIMEADSQSSSGISSGESHFKDCAPDSVLNVA